MMCVPTSFAISNLLTSSHIIGILQLWLSALIDGVCDAMSHKKLNVDLHDFNIDPSVWYIKAFK